MNFIIYCLLYLFQAAVGFSMLLAIGAAVVYWQERHRRRERAFFNGRT